MSAKRDTGITGISLTVNDHEPITLDGEATARFLAGGGLDEGTQREFVDQVAEGFAAMGIPARQLSDGHQVTGDGEILEESPSQHEPWVHPWGLRPPAPEAFTGEDGETIAFLPAPELVGRAQELIGRYEELAFLRELDISVLWKAAGGKTGGKAVLGKCTRPSGLLAFYSELDFVIWLAADHVREWRGTGLTESQVEALLYHELSHIGWDDDNDKPIVVAHDFSEFRRVIERYGLWLDDAKAMDKTFQQLRLTGTEAA